MPDLGKYGAEVLSADLECALKIVPSVVQIALVADDRADVVEGTGDERVPWPACLLRDREHALEEREGLVEIAASLVHRAEAGE